VEVVEGRGMLSATRSHHGNTHISGSFVMSATAAIGIPKLLAGPQKSALQKYHHQLANIHKADIVRNFGRNSERERKRTVSYIRVEQK